MSRSITTDSVGDLIIACVHNGAYGSHTKIAYSVGVSDSQDAITWHSGASVQGQETTNSYDGKPDPSAYEIWYGVVKTANQVTTVKATFAPPGVTDLFLYVDSWTSGNGSLSSWSVRESGFVNFTGSSSTITFPSLKTDSAKGIYWGYTYSTPYATGPVTSPSSGFTLYDTPTYGNGIVTNPNLADATAYAPTLKQPFSNGTGWYEAIALVIADLTPQLFNATFSGKPKAGTGGVYPITLHASTAGGLKATQKFDLVVKEEPAFTSRAKATVHIGAEHAVKITTHGYPLPKISLSGKLPHGIHFKADHARGTATISGKPDAVGVHHLELTASNGVSRDAHQKFMLTVARRR